MKSKPKKPKHWQLKTGDIVFVPMRIVAIHENGGQHPWKCYEVEYKVDDCSMRHRLIESEFVRKP